MKSLILVAALACGCAHALDAPTTSGLHLATKHERAGYNSDNPGFYFRWNNGLTLGAYRNSEWRNSAYAGWTFADRDDHFAITLGAVTGYQRGTTPLVVPSVRLPLTQGMSARLSLLAPYQKGTAAVHLSVEWRL